MVPVPQSAALGTTPAAESNASPAGSVPLASSTHEPMAMRTSLEPWCLAMDIAESPLCSHGASRKRSGGALSAGGAELATATHSRARRRGRHALTGVPRRGSAPARISRATRSALSPWAANISGDQPSCCGGPAKRASSQRLKKLFGCAGELPRRARGGEQHCPSRLSSARAVEEIAHSTTKSASRLGQCTWPAACKGRSHALRGRSFQEVPEAELGNLIAASRVLLKRQWSLS